MGQHTGAQNNSSNPYVRNVRDIFSHLVKCYYKSFLLQFLPTSNVTIWIFIGLLILFSDINRAVVDTTDIVYNRIMSPWLWPDWVFYLHSQGRSMKSCVQTLHRFSENVIDDRIRYTVCIYKCTFLERCLHTFKFSVKGHMMHKVMKRKGRTAAKISLHF